MFQNPVELRIVETLTSGPSFQRPFSALQWTACFVSSSLPMAFHCPSCLENTPPVAVRPDLSFISPLGKPVQKTTFIRPLFSEFSDAKLTSPALPATSNQGGLSAGAGGSSPARFVGPIQKTPLHRRAPGINSGARRRDAAPPT